MLGHFLYNWRIAEHGSAGFAPKLSFPSRRSCRIKVYELHEPDGQALFRASPSFRLVIRLQLQEANVLNIRMTECRIGGGYNFVKSHVEWKEVPRCKAKARTRRRTVRTRHLDSQWNRLGCYRRGSRTCPATVTGGVGSGIGARPVVRRHCHLYMV